MPSQFLAGTSSGVVMFTSLAAALCLAATAVPMAQVGALLNRRAAGPWFRRIFASAIVIVAIRLFWTL